MEKIHLENKDNLNVIVVDVALITRVCDAMYSLESALFALEKCSPESVESFKKNVCNFIKEIHDAFLES